MSAFFLLMVFVLIVVMLFLSMTGLIAMFRNRFGSWGKSYHQLAKRYGAQVAYSLGKPRMSFNYAGIFCTLKNTTSRLQDNRQTQLVMRWRDRKFKMWISSTGLPAGARKLRKLSPVVVHDEGDRMPFLVYSNQPELARQMLTPSTRWQIRQLIHLHGNSGVEVRVQQGQLRVSKPGYIIQFRPLDDFVRFGLELFDQFQLAYNQDIEFVSDDATVVVAEVKCPICSEVINQEMVVCVRCKTPHCVDCWEYNGQCATFACHETRYISTGSRSAGLPHA